MLRSGVGGSIAAVAMVALVVLVVVLVNSGGGGTSSASRASTATSTPPTAPVPPPTSTGAVPSSSARPSPSVGRSSPPPTRAPFRGNVVIYRKTTSAAMANAAAVAFTRAGWVVLGVNDVREELTRTTVFYDAGMVDSANAMVNAHIGVLAAEPRPRTLRSTGSLIVIVTSNYTAA